MQRYQGVALDTTGNIVASATIEVLLQGTATQATIFADNSYTAKANPFTGDADGSFEFHARNGRYDIKITKTGFTFDTSMTFDVVLFDASSVISPAQITADQNDYGPANALNASISCRSTPAARVPRSIGSAAPRGSARRRASAAPCATWPRSS